MLALAIVVHACGMLGPAINDPGAVIFIEHAQLYATEDDVRLQRRVGTDVTLITYGGSLPKTLRAATLLEQDGIQAEVIDPQVLRPPDDGTKRGSARKTHCVVVGTEGWKTGCLSAKAAARIMQRGCYDLNAAAHQLAGKQ